MNSFWLEIYYFLRRYQLLKRETFRADLTYRAAPPTPAHPALHTIIALSQHCWTSLSLGLDDGLPMKNPVHTTCRINLKTILCRYDRGTDRSMVEFWIYWIPTLAFSYRSLLDLRGMIFVSSLAWRLVGDKFFIMRFLWNRNYFRNCVFILFLTWEQKSSVM